MALKVHIVAGRDKSGKITILAAGEDVGKVKSRFKSLRALDSADYSDIAFGRLEVALQHRHREVKPLTEAKA